MIPILKAYLPLFELALITSLIVGYALNTRTSIFNKKRLLVTLVILITLLVPVNWLASDTLPWKLPFVAYIRAATGDLSMTTLFLCIVGLSNLKKTSIQFSTILFIAICAVIFYPLALGVGMIDPYAWGYSSPIFFGLLSAFAAVLILKNRLLEAIIFAIAIMAWSTQWHESTNLWDYLIDPFVATWAIFKSIQIWMKNKSSII